MSLEKYCVLAPARILFDTRRLWHKYFCVVASVVVFLFAAADLKESVTENELTLCCRCPGEGAGRGGLQLQLLGCRPGEDLWSLLVPGGEPVDPVTVARQLLHPLQQGHAPSAATQQHAVQRLPVGERTGWQIYFYGLSEPELVTANEDCSSTIV